MKEKRKGHCAAVFKNSVIVTGRVPYNFGILPIVQFGKNLALSGSKIIKILAMFAKNRKIPALNLALHNYTNSK